MLKAVTVFHRLSLTVSSGAGKKTRHCDLMLQELGSVFTCLLYECVGLLSVLCACVCVW